MRIADAALCGDLEASAVARLGHLTRRRDARGLRERAFPGAADRADIGDLRRRGELLATVKRGEQRDTHQDAGGDTGEECSGQPSCGNFAPVGRTCATAADERWVVAEIGYRLVVIVHQKGDFFPNPAQLSFL
jgi:hypothetical protein